MQFIPIEALAGKLGLPLGWLKTEAEAGRIPVLPVGRFLRFDLEAVRRCLVQRSAAEQHDSHAPCADARAEPRCVDRCATDIHRAIEQDCDVAHANGQQVEARS
jgi:hypothetical protein